MRNESRPPRADYDFFLTAVNPNKMTALCRSGSAVLLHKGRTLARGGVGQPADGGEDATDFNMLLPGVPHDGHTPRAPMAYAVVVDPGAVDSTDEPSYQTHVRSKIEMGNQS